MANPIDYASPRPRTNLDVNEDHLRLTIWPSRRDLLADRIGMTALGAVVLFTSVGLVIAMWALMSAQQWNRLSHQPEARWFAVVIVGCLTVGIAGPWVTYPRACRTPMVLETRDGKLQLSRHNSVNLQHRYLALSSIRRIVLKKWSLGLGRGSAWMLRMSSGWQYIEILIPDHEIACQAESAIRRIVERSHTAEEHPS
jgi:hypothetical protein